MQITSGGPILMAQVENEYGSFGSDAEYMGKLRQALVDGGFNIPMFACNPPYDIHKGFRKDLFQVANFGSDPEKGFKTLREFQSTGPLMCGEFYPGWFDTWGASHHLGNTPRYLADLEYMLNHGASFSIYMVHGGTTFGMWSGADRPFKPDTSSYDYDAPISEAGWCGEKFRVTRELMSKYLMPGEKLPDPPAANPVMSVPEFTLNETAGIFENLPAAVSDASPRNMEAYDQEHGCILYRTTLSAGSAATLRADSVRDFAWVFLDGKQIGVMDRRWTNNEVRLPERSGEARLDMLVEAMGHLNYGRPMEDRKGLRTPVQLVCGDTNLTFSGSWQVYPLRLDKPMLRSLKWRKEAANGPAFWRGTFGLDKAADTFLDLRSWGKGVIWVNGHCLGRYWNIGPTQTAYLPGPWLHKGRNEVVILDLLGPTKPVMAGVEKPVLDQLRPELDFGGVAGK
jgi:beta-galactosidase